MYIVQSQINCKDVDNKVRNSFKTVAFPMRHFWDVKQSLIVLPTFIPPSCSWWRTVCASWGICPIRFTVKSLAVNAMRRPYLSTRAGPQPAKVAALALEKAKVGAGQLFTLSESCCWMNGICWWGWACWWQRKLSLFFTLYHCFPVFLSSLLISSHPISLLPFSLLCLDEWFSKGKIFLLAFSPFEAVCHSHHLLY